jgi:hypothetical protein
VREVSEASRLAEGTVTESQLWPEHFDLAVTVDVDGSPVNVGFSPGDSDSPEPYVYLGPHERAGLTGSYWNAPFGASLPYRELRATNNSDHTIEKLIDRGLRLIGTRPANAGRVN